MHRPGRLGINFGKGEDGESLSVELGPTGAERFDGGRGCGGWRGHVRLVWEVWKSMGQRCNEMERS